VKNPISRTNDVVESIPVLTSQIIAFDKLDEPFKVIKIKDLQDGDVPKFDKQDMPKFIRFSCEEIMRRRIKKGTDPISK
jgi:hypothetical protein